jgi:MerR family transcriptional regulator, light-induced transcriptional regulator
LKNQPQYRIQAVSRMTGVPAHTLRAWERRYGVPTPQRTDSAYRLYTEVDVDLIRRLKARTDAGMAPSQAAVLVKRLAEAGEALPAPLPADAFEAAVTRITDAVERFDPLAVERAVRGAMVLGSARAIFDRVFAPALRRIGTAQAAGHISVAQEHLASEHLGTATRELLRLLQPDTPVRQVLLACVQDEFHVSPLYGSALHFAQWGYGVVMLGVNTPPDALADAVAAIRPNAVGLSTSQALSAERAPALLAAYATACGDVPWVVGGAGAAGIAEAVRAAGGLVTSGAPETIRAELAQQIDARAAAAP